MTHKGKRKCRHCHAFFKPDPRNVRHQRYCSHPQCRRASKAASQRKWLHRPANADYFKGPEQVARVQAWRRAHPGYSRRTRGEPSLTPTPLQDHLIVQVTDNAKETSDLVDPALQDLLSAQPVVLLGLIASLTGSTLQDDIVNTSRKMLRLGQDVLNRPSPVGRPHGHQTPITPRAGAPPADAV